MAFKYIKNNHVWRKQQKKISKLQEKSYADLTIHEKLEIAYDKFFKKEKISYSEFEMILMANDEIEFEYKKRVYEVVHTTANVTTICISSYDVNDNPIKNYVTYSTVTDLLEQFRIDGKTIKEVWDEVVL